MLNCHTFPKKILTTGLYPRFAVGMDTVCPFSSFLPIPAHLPTVTVGRLAPSPTGYLHLGNAWAFLLAWLAARHAGGRVILRMEDIDPDRSRPHYAQAIMDDLQWLGLDWDCGPDTEQGPELLTPIAYTQSQRGHYYSAALHQLTTQGHVYPCYCTRKELRNLAAAPHVGDAGAPYPNTCRNLSPEQQAAHEAAGRKAAVRLRCPQGLEGTVHFIDRIQGPQYTHLDACGGDFALRRSDGVVAYQLAVVVDDALMGVTQVLRGDDIRISTPRQILLYRLLGYPVPEYAHVPLLLNHQGERLAKRHASLTLGALREAGVTAHAIVGYLAHKARLVSQLKPYTAQALVPHFSMGALPKEGQTTESNIQTVLLGLTQV